MERYSVLLTSDVTPPTPRVAVALGRALGRPEGEVARRVKEGPWILLEEVDARELDDVFEILSREGVTARAVPEVHMPVLPPALRCRYADPIPRGLFLQRAAPPAPPVLPWEELRVVSAGQTPDGLLADLVSDGERPLRLRIDAGNFNYDFLGKRMKPSSRENLRLLLEEIADRAPGARLTERTTRLVAGAPIPEYRFRTVAGFDTYTLWALEAVTEAEE